MTAGLLVGIAAQFVAFVLTGRPASEVDSGNPTLLDLVEGYGLHVFLQTWYPAVGGVGTVLVERGWSLVILASLPFLIALVALVAGSRERLDVVTTAAIAGGAVLPFVAGLVLNFRSYLQFSEFGLEALAVLSPLRYAFVPSMFVLAAVVLVADRLARRRTRVANVVAAGVLVGLASLGIVHLDAGPTSRSGYPGWAAGVAAAERECRAGVERVVIPHAPETWEVELACAVVTDGASRR
jgi:hypothetical protein